MKKIISLLLVLILTISTTSVVMAKNYEKDAPYSVSYLKDINGAEYIRYNKFEDTQMEDGSMIQQTIEMYDVLSLYLKDNNWKSIIKPFRTAFTSAGFTEKENANNGDVQYIYSKDINETDTEVFMILGEKESQAIINESGLVYIKHAILQFDYEHTDTDKKTEEKNTENTTKTLLVHSVNGSISVILNGQNINFDTPPQIINGRTMVPLRAIFEALGATVEWNDDTQTVTSTKDDITITLTINNAIMYVNENDVTLDSPACLVDSRTLVPVRAVSEAFGVDVEWKETKPAAPIVYDDISANINQINYMISNGLYLEAMKECEQTAAWHNCSPDDIKLLSSLKSAAQGKYDEYEKSEQNKMMDVYASVLLRQYRAKMKNPASFALHSVYAGFDSSIYSNYDFVAVVDVSGQNSYGGTTRSQYVMLLKTDEGKFMLDLKGYADDMADGAWGNEKLSWMDVALKALKLEASASSKLKKLDTNLITQLVLSK